MGLWGYRQFDKILDIIRDRYHIHALDQPEDAWRSKNPQIAAKLDELESRLSTLEKN
jgi:hypothetical protein